MYILFEANIEVIKNEIRKSYREGSSATAAEISRRLRARRIRVGTTQIKFWRDRLGFKRASTKYCQVIREENKAKRLEFCEDMIARRERFLDCIFTDESTFQLGCSTKYCYIEEGSETARLRSRAKHPGKLHVWGGISSRGTTDLATFNGSVRMDSKLYCEILEDCYLDSSNKAFNGISKLVQDNASSHKRVYTTRRLHQWGVKEVNWPAESPDLNPIELVWGSMKSSIRRQHLRTLGELETAIRDYWRQLTPDVCRVYIEGIQWRMPLVVSARGGNIIEKKILMEK
ncbi:hypothetical protein ANCCAN_14363 [Ancylostoma caninum]|uniref:Tc1-like transposase DDE domain-containing protein n=1 Tax=Ancylostoma caninum TaxID=29170 RepID=A0A368G5K4_ANCCA|nr:hypothetical protein ANCCAN_14363 [Ancylostoma caninum]